MLVAHRPSTRTAERRRAVGQIIGAALVVSMAAGPFSPASAAASGAPTQVTNVVGDVVATATAAPVAGAVVSIPALRRSTTSGRGGTFAFDGVATAMPYRRVRIVVRAPGFGTWSISGVPLYPNDTLELHAALHTAAHAERFETPRERARDAAAATADVPRGTGNATCTGWTSQLEPPPTIAVADHTDGSRLGRYDFSYYLRHVLPSEWIPSWDADALGAGAIAAKDYAWWRAEPDHAFSGGSGCSDLTDYTADQVFNPAVAYASTDLAVADTLGTLARQNDQVFMAQYWSGSASSGQEWLDCSYVNTGTFKGRMSQWGTQTCATNGKLWTNIVTIFYPSTQLNYTSNILLDPSAEDPNGYPWTASPASAFSRVKGDAYKGGYYFSVTKRTTVTQTRALSDQDVAGSGSTLYTLSVALLCPKSVVGTCTVRLKVATIAHNGTTVIQVDRVTENHDAKWRVYTFDVPASGSDHQNVEAEVVTNQAASFDWAQLTMPFGGP
jgi:Carboxypeptidase regulatory-like domain/Stage II sporulation protein